MNIAVRYYSRSGNTKAVADAIAKEVGADAVSVEKADAQINEPVDVLFIGGALYAYGLDSHMKEYLKTLKRETVKKAVVFSTSWLSKHSVELIKKGLSENGIAVENEYFYVKNKPSEAQKKEAAVFARKFIQED
ncbi:MAG: flavodoxin [Ruminococcaceae bacterium]|nr:flavodoxin [Oscillospiraceae bacterium]